MYDMLEKRQTDLSVIPYPLFVDRRPTRIPVVKQRSVPSPMQSHSQYIHYTFDGKTRYACKHFFETAAKNKTDVGWRNTKARRVQINRYI
jgi:hypothetical protein